MARGEAARSTFYIIFGLIALTIAASASLAQEEVIGPEIVFMGLLRADDTIVDSSGSDESGRPVFDRPFGFGFSIVVEAKRGLSKRPVGENTFSDPGCPDFQIQVSRSLGNGSTAVCDTLPPDDGGVPAIDPPQLTEDSGICAVENDLGCRFVDGAGDQLGRTCSEGCVLFTSGDLGCVSEATEIQFCGRMAKSVEFPPGETLVTARLRDIAGNPGEPAQIIVRVATPTATPTLAPSATFTPLPSATQVDYDQDGCMLVPPKQNGGSGALALLPVLVLWIGLIKNVRGRR